MQKIRIVDLDSTITDDTWRHWLIDLNMEDTNPAKYYAYHLHCDGDKVINRHIVDESPYDVFFVTARHEYVREKTKRWLDDNGLKYKALVMRGNDDHQSSVDLKRKTVQFLKEYFEFENAYDDRKDIVEMYNSIGIKGILVC